MILLQLKSGAGEVTPGHNQLFFFNQGFPQIKSPLLNHFEKIILSVFFNQSWLKLDKVPPQRERINIPIKKRKHCRSDIKGCRLIFNKSSRNTWGENKKRFSRFSQFFSNFFPIHLKYHSSSLNDQIKPLSTIHFLAPSQREREREIAETIRDLHKYRTNINNAMLAITGIQISSLMTVFNYLV